METPGVERRRHEGRIEARGVPSPLAEASWEPLPRKCFDFFELKKASFGAFWILFLQLN